MSNLASLPAVQIVSAVGVALPSINVLRLWALEWRNAFAAKAVAEARREWELEHLQAEVKKLEGGTQ